MELDAIQLLLIIGGIAFLCGVLLTIVIALIVWSNKMNHKAAEESTMQQIMTGLTRSCDGIETVISEINPAQVNIPGLKSEIARRLSMLETRLEEFLEGLDPYYGAYIALRIDGYRQLLYKIDEFGSAIAHFGNEESCAAEAADAVAYEGEAAVATTSAAAAQQQPPPPPEQPLAQQQPPLPSQQPPDIDMDSAGDFLQAPPDATPPMPSAPSFEAPVSPPPQQPAPAQPAAAAADEAPSDEDLMYGQTMQFSMSDIEAARQGKTPPQEARPLAPDTGQDTPQQPPAQEAISFEAPAVQSPVISDDMAETLVFATDDIESSPSPAPQPDFSAQLQQAPAPPPPRPQPQQPQNAKKEEGLISGDDLMDQMDSFFNFDS